MPVAAFTAVQRHSDELGPESDGIEKAGDLVDLLAGLLTSLYPWASIHNNVAFSDVGRQAQFQSGHPAEPASFAKSLNRLSLPHFLNL